MANQDPLKFKVAPHIVEDLGLNLYTNLPRVLAEYVANAYDADATEARVTIDVDAIQDERQRMRAKHREQVEAGQEGIEPLATRVLPTEFTITIEDDGHGMNREDLDSKYLFAGRRRRAEDGGAGARSPGDRLVTGRKGLGKLAGFGVGKQIDVTTKTADAATAIQITLNYDTLIQGGETHEVPVPEVTLENDGGLGTQGTRVVLSLLMHDPVKSRRDTIATSLADHFALIDPDEFKVLFNGDHIEVPTPGFAYAWPEPELSETKFVERTLKPEDGDPVSFMYRIRFMPPGHALPAARRGVRVYSNKRLSSAPSLLGADTNMHGFRMTDYMDGVVHADFIDEQRTDYIATDRQSLRWESPLLAPVHDFLSSEIKEACKQYQKKRDIDAPDIVAEDEFTSGLVAEHDFSARDRKLAFKIAAHLESSCKQSVKDPVYREKLPVIVGAIGSGNLAAAINDLAAADNPDLERVAVEIVKLTRDELDQFVRYARMRVIGVAALKRIVEAVDFKEAENEKVLQGLFERAPWLVNATYSQFLTADRSLRTLFGRLAKHLEIGDHAPDGADQSSKRPDLVFLVGSQNLNTLVIIELKSANLPLEQKHLEQLRYYQVRARKWLKQHDHGAMKVQGHLIGTLPDPDSKAQGVVILLDNMDAAGPSEDWKVRDYLQVLEEAEAAHKELLDASEDAEAPAAED